jgi:hypothetical protein
MALLKTLANELNPLCESAPIAALVFNYRRAAREFFERTTAWRAELSSTSVASANQTLVPPTDAEIYGITTCALGTTLLKRMTQEQFRRDYGYSYAGPPVGFRFGGLNTLVLEPAATVAGATITTSVILRPTDTATTLDDEMATRYKQAIFDGAASKLLRVPKQPWTNYQLAMEHQERFDDAIDRQSWLGPDGGIGTPRRVRYGGY